MGLHTVVSVLLITPPGGFQTCFRKRQDDAVTVLEMRGNALRVTNGNSHTLLFVIKCHHVCRSHLVFIFSLVSTLAADMNQSRSLLKHTQWIIGLNMLIWDNSWTILEQRRNGQDFISPIFSHPLISSDVEMTLGKLSWAFNHTGVCSCQGSSVCRVERQGRSLILGQWSSPSELVTVSLR